MSFDGDDFGCGYDEDYDPADDIYAGTAACDDGSDRDYDDRIEGGDIEGELGIGEVDACEVDDADDDSDVHESFDHDDHYME